MKELREDPPGRGPIPEGLGWEPLDLSAPGGDIASLLAKCDWIDCLVPAVTHMRGGSGEGYARWEAFRTKGLDLYAAHRNNAIKRCASSAGEIITVLGVATKWAPNFSMSFS